MRGEDGRTWFDLELDLEDYGFPEDALVRVEAWRSNTVQRWMLGTVGALKMPARDERRLSDVTDAAQFRVLVVAGDNSGLLYGLSKDLRPVKRQTEGDESDEGRTSDSMLPVEVVDDLGEEVWRLDFGDGDVPALQVNGRINSITEIVANDPAFRSLIMPDILRAILHRAIYWLT